VRILPAWCDEDGRIRFCLAPDDAPLHDVEIPEPYDRVELYVNGVPVLSAEKGPRTFAWNGVLVEDEEVEA